MQYLERIIFRIYEGAETEQDRQARLMLARIRMIIDEDFRLHLDHCNIMTWQDLKKALESWETSHSGLHRDDNNRSKRHASVICHKCHKPGHMAAYCRSAQVDLVQPQTSTQKSDSPVPRCYSCGTLGHKSPDYPNRQKEHIKDMQQKMETQSKKKDRMPKHQAKISTADANTYNIVTATLCGCQLPILLDTGAQMTVVPEELVSPIAHTGNQVQLRSFDGGVREVSTASVSMRFGEREWQGEVALVKLKELNDKGILAVNVSDSVSLEILCSYMEKETPRVVSAVETRSKAKEKEEEEQEIHESENAGTTELSLEDEEEVEEGDHDEVLEESLVAGDKILEKDEVLEESLVAGDEILAKEVVDENVVSDKGEESLILSCVRENREREAFIVEVKVDPSLQTCRDLADKCAGGYMWKDSLLIQSRFNDVFGDTEVIVVPKTKRTSILQFTHERLGHLGYKSIHGREVSNKPTF